MSGPTNSDKDIIDKLTKSHQRLCRLEAEMSANKMLMVIVTVLAVGTVLLNRSR